MWTDVHKRLHRKQRRIFKASKDGNKYLVCRLQLQLINSLDAKLAAVQRVTVLNERKNTKRIDSRVYPTNQQKIKLAYSLNLDGKAMPIKRVSILKPGKEERRPLRIPTIKDKAKQYLAKFALEPEWEARFESNSYGFRPGRSAHDAVQAIFIMLVKRERHVLCGDISECFNQINHTALLSKLDTFPKMEVQIRAWLKAEVMTSYAHREKDNEFSTIDTSQGKIISLLLANIVLHGLENHIKQWYIHECRYDLKNQKGYLRYNQEIAIIRYADDFVIIHDKKDVIDLVRVEVSKWLSIMGLELSNDKTQIRRANQGFVFLGHKCITINGQGGHRVKVHISKSSKIKLINRLGIELNRHKASSAYVLVQSLSRIIVEWGNYFRYSECTDDFKQMNARVHNLIRAWVFRRTAQNKGRLFLREKYFPTGQSYIYNGVTHKDNWVLTGSITVNGETRKNFLPKLTWIRSQRHIKVKGSASPFDGNHIYWSQRLVSY